jgi:hypothetical protein
MKASLLFTKSKSLLLTLLIGLSLISTSCVDGEGGTNIEIPGVDGPKLTITDDNLMIAMVFENIQLEGGLRYNIPKYPNSHIEISPDLQSEGTLMALSISLDDVFNLDLGTLDPQKLPGGRPLPTVSTGKLPAVAFSIEKFHGMVFYVGPEVFGVFIPANLDFQGGMLTSRFYAMGKRAGTLALVGTDENDENSGLLMLLDLKGSTKARLKKLSEKY